MKFSPLKHNFDYLYSSRTGIDKNVPVSILMCFEVTDQSVQLMSLQFSTTLNTAAAIKWTMKTQKILKLSCISIHSKVIGFGFMQIISLHWHGNPFTFDWLMINKEISLLNFVTPELKCTNTAILFTQYVALFALVTPTTSHNTIFTLYSDQPTPDTL